MIGVDPHKGSHTAVAIGALRALCLPRQITAAALNAQNAQDAPSGGSTKRPTLMWIIRRVLPLNSYLRRPSRVQPDPGSA
jgi:hypothetical protein